MSLITVLYQCSTKENRILKVHVYRNTIYGKRTFVFSDFAVGAPYDDNGAVYIYHGTIDGIIGDYSQVR